MDTQKTAPTDADYLSLLRPVAQPTDRFFAPSWLRFAVLKAAQNEDWEVVRDTADLIVKLQSMHRGEA